MSGENQPTISMAEPQLTPDEFQKFFDAEAAKLKGDNAPYRELIKEHTEKAQSSPPVEEKKEESAPAPVEEAKQPEEKKEEQQQQTEASKEPEASATEGDSAAADDPADWVNTLDPGVRAQVEKILAEKQKLEHKIKSDEGRVAAYQRHFETARAERDAALKAAQLQQSKPAAVPAAVPGQQTPNQKVIPPEIQAIFDAGDETLGKALLKTYEENERIQRALEERDAQLNAKTERLARQQEEIYLNQQLDLLEKNLPGAKEVLAHDIWDEFKRVAPPGLQALSNSHDWREVATALQEYQVWIQRPDVQAWAEKKYGKPEQQTATTTTQAAAPARQPDPQQVAQAEKVKAAAERKAAATPVNSTSVGRPVTQQPTFEQILADPKLHADWFAKEFEKETAKLQGRK